ncbi:extragenic suppressor protein SuhB [gamma proteobacterium HdN1]|nr:extragenic suppressor protein SuhB [gamma proteobacterium HdN1]
MHPMLNSALSVARTAGDLLVRAFDNVDSLKVETKGANDYVTSVDRGLEETIITGLQKRYPKHGFLAEESGRIAGTDEGQDYLWIIDPLDGTTNFIHGIPQFAISIALEVKGQLEVAVVYDPVKKEEFTATRGRGASLNGKRIRVSNRRGLQGALLGTGFPFRPDQAKYVEPYINILRTLTQETAGIRRPGAAALDLAWVAAGRFDGFWEFGLQSWDMAAGILLIQEAGGLVGDPTGGMSHMDTGNIVCGPAKVFKALLQVTQPALAKK